MASTPVRPSPLSPFESANNRQSPFRRQNSVSPATVRATTPTQSPTKTFSNLSPTKNGSLSPEKASPFVRRPSQVNHNAARPSSPFARPTSSLSIASSPTRKAHDESTPDDEFLRTTALRASRQPSVAPVSDEDEPTADPSSPSPFISSSTAAAKPSPSLRSPLASPQIPSQANLRPASQRPNPAATTTPTRAYPSSTPTAPTSAIPTANINPPIFTPLPQQQRHPLPNLTPGGGAYTHLPPALLHSMRESFEVLDSANAGSVDSGAVAEMLAQLNLSNDAAALSAFFPPHGAPRLNLARYLDTLSSPLGELSAPEELRAAFEAFDLEDSGQVDLGMLREALMRGGGGEEGGGMEAGEMEAVLREFGGRRAFGGKGGGKGEVFRYRDFMASVSAGGMGAEGGNGEGVVA